MAPLINSTVARYVRAESIALTKFITRNLACGWSRVCLCIYMTNLLACTGVGSRCNERFLRKSTCRCVA